MGEFEAIVADLGSFMTRVGLAGYDVPKLQVPTVVGHPKVSSAMSIDTKDFFVGQEALTKREFLSLSYPVVDKEVTAWDDVEKLVGYLCNNELNLDFSQHKFLLCEPPQQTRAFREQWTEMLFEKFNVHSLYLSSSSTLSLFATGRTTGVVVESGQNSTHICPIYEGYAFPHAYGRLPIGGDHITRMLIDCLRQKGDELPQSKEFEIAAEIKEKTCYVSQDFQQELSSAQEAAYQEKPYELPDNRTILLSVERCKCPETLFQPALLEKDLPGLHEFVFASVMKCDSDIRKNLYYNIVLCGGNSMFRNFKLRLTRDVKALAPSNMDVKVAAPPERKHLAWMGGALLSSIDTFKMWIKRAEYSELGAAVVHRKCF